MMFILSRMACASQRNILLQQITQSNLKFHCKIHERMRGPEAGGGGIFSRYNPPGTATQAYFSIIKHAHEEQR